MKSIRHKKAAIRAFLCGWLLAAMILLLFLPLIESKAIPYWVACILLGGVCMDKLGRLCPCALRCILALGLALIPHFLSQAFAGGGLLFHICDHTIPSLYAGASSFFLSCMILAGFCCALLAVSAMG